MDDLSDIASTTPTTMKSILDFYQRVEMVCELGRAAGMSAEEAVARLAGLGATPGRHGVFDDDDNEIEPFEEE